MSGTFPTTIKPSSLSLQDNRPNLINQSVSGKRVTRKYGSQFFTLDITLPSLSKDDAMDVFAFLKKQQNSFDKFDYQYPITNRGANRTQTDIVVNGSHSVGDNTIALSGFDNSTTDVLKAGDVIKFANHDKVYMVTKDNSDPPVNPSSDGSGNATVTIEPSIISSLANSEAVTVDQPNFKVYLNGDILYATDTSGFFAINFSLRECIE
tara:strand:+ start:37 stop:660 length:624 start_codon:yes stop_codon:yes gene_type:complete